MGAFCLRRVCMVRPLAFVVQGISFFFSGFLLSSQAVVAAAVLGALHTAATKSTGRLLNAPTETSDRHALIDYMEAPYHFPPAATPTPTLLLEPCTPLMRALSAQPVQVRHVS